MEKAVRALSFPLSVRLLSVPSLLCLLFLLCCVPVGRPCLQCDRRVRLLHEDYLLAAASATIEDQIELKKILDYAYVTYTTTSNQYSGVIGPLTFEAIQILEKGRQFLEIHLQTFVQKGLCPNKCGLLYQRVNELPFLSVQAAHLPLYHSGLRGVSSAGSRGGTGSVGLFPPLA